MLNQQNIYYTPINFIKEIVNQNIQMTNQISYNNNIINLIIKNPLFFPNQNNINIMNNQIPHSNLIHSQKEKELFPGNNNRRINVFFQATNGSQTRIAAPINIKIKDLFLAYANKMEINPLSLGKEIFFIFNGHKVNINEQKDLISFGLKENFKISVFDSRNIMGGNLNV